MPTIVSESPKRQPRHYTPPTGENPKGPKGRLAAMRRCGLGSVEHANTTARDYLKDVAEMLLKHPEHTTWAMELIQPIIEAAAIANADNDLAMAKMAYATADAESDRLGMLAEIDPSEEVQRKYDLSVHREIQRATELLAIRARRRLKVVRS